MLDACPSTKLLLLLRVKEIRSAAISKRQRQTSSAAPAAQYIMVTFHASEVTMVKSLAGFFFNSLFMMFIIMSCKDYENFIF